VSLESLGFRELCKLGLAITWPLALVAGAGRAGFLIFMLVAVHAESSWAVSHKRRSHFERARALNAEIAALETQIKELDSKVKRGNPSRAFVPRRAHRGTPCLFAHPPAGTRVEEVDHQR